jgi:hypothetical protein
MTFVVRLRADGGGDAPIFELPVVVRTKRDAELEDLMTEMGVWKVKECEFPIANADVVQSKAPAGLASAGFPQ